jgi:hypothetical protein
MAERTGSGLPGTNIALQPGMNRLQQLYLPSVAIRSEEPEVNIRASATPLYGTRAEDRRNPQAASVVLPMAWADAIALATAILQNAQIARVPLPEGVSAPTEFPMEVRRAQADGSELPWNSPDIPDTAVLVDMDVRRRLDGTALAVQFTRGDGIRFDAILSPQEAGVLVERLIRNGAQPSETAANEP